MILPHTIIRQAFGRFDRRHLVGPAQWPHFDILWLHRGGLALEIDGARIAISAPGGVLIAPDTAFSGRAATEIAVASICHFDAAEPMESPFQLADSRNAAVIQAMLELLMRYGEQAFPWPAQARLLTAIIDAFEAPVETDTVPKHLSRAWTIAAARLDRVRSLADVAEAIDISESSFRALHRSHYGTSAGQHLLALRMERAAARLATTGDRVADIAKAVGYASAESFSRSFRRYFGSSPRRFREQASRFA